MKVVNAVYDETPVVTIAFTRNEVNLLRRLVNYDIDLYKSPGSGSLIFEPDQKANDVLAQPLHDILSYL